MSKLRNIILTGAAALTLGCGERSPLEQRDVTLNFLEYGKYPARYQGQVTIRDIADPADTPRVGIEVDLRRETGDDRGAYRITGRNEGGYWVGGEVQYQSSLTGDRGCKFGNTVGWQNKYLPESRFTVYGTCNSQQIDYTTRILHQATVEARKRGLPDIK